jgi:hypothetical protein
MKEAPIRACRLVLDIHADTEDDLIDALNGIGTNIAMGQLTDGYSAGYRSSYTYKYIKNDSPSHDEYIEMLNEYIAEKHKDNE